MSKLPWIVTVGGRELSRHATEQEAKAEVRRIHFSRPPMPTGGARWAEVRIVREGEAR